MGRPKGNKTALVQPRPQGPEDIPQFAGFEQEADGEPKEQAEPQEPKEPKEPERRERKRGSGPACPRCGVDDTFAAKGKGKYPKHIEDRMRHYECGQCKYIFEKTGK